MPLISVITPVYNKETYISNAIESVLNQEFDAFEYIIIDDGSTDHSPDIVDEYAKRDERIRVIHQQNQWIYASFNNGIREASGEYIYILNADDKLRKNALKLMAEKADQFKPDVIWTKVLIHKADFEQNILEYDYAHWNEKVSEDSYQKDKEELKKAWLFLNTSLLVQNQANLYKRDLMLKHPFRNDVYGADTLFNIAIADDILSSYVLCEPVYDFFEYINFDNVSVGKYYDYEHEMFNDMYTDHRKLLKKWGNTDKKLLDCISQKRLGNFSIELRNYKYCNTLTTDEKLQKMLVQSEDPIIYECAKNLNAFPELERRLLFGVKGIADQEGIDESSKFSYLGQLLKLLEKQKYIIDNTKKLIDQSENWKNTGSHFGRLLYESELSNYIKYFYKS